jgi:hypothetical protein
MGFAYRESREMKFPLYAGMDQKSSTESREGTGNGEEEGIADWVPF